MGVSSSMKKFQLNQEETSLLCRELALLMHAGVDPGSGLTLLAEETDAPRMRDLLKSISDKTDEGIPLSDAVRETGALPEYVSNLMFVGEQTGRMEDALQALADYYHYQVQLTRRLRSALTYPLVLMLVMLVVIVVLLVRVLPVFEGVYARLGGSMTGVAGSLLHIGQLLGAAMPVLCVLVALFLGFVAALCLCDGFRKRVVAYVQKTFSSMNLLRRMNASRFAQALAMGINSGLMPEESVELAAKLCKDLPIAQACETCISLLREGQPLAKSLDACGLLPSAQCRMLELGFRSGCEDSVIRQIAAQLHEDAQNALEGALGRIEPTMVLTTSILVGLILLSVMLPLMDIMSTIG